MGAAEGQGRDAHAFWQWEAGGGRWCAGVRCPTAACALAPQGLAHCFEKGDDGKLVDRFVIEPITANSLECMANGAPRLGGCPALRNPLMVPCRAPAALALMPLPRRAMPAQPLQHSHHRPHSRPRPTAAKTCFKHVFSMTLEEAMSKNKSYFPPEFAEGVFCENYDARCDACARTWMRPHAMENLL